MKDNGELSPEEIAELEKVEAQKEVERVKQRAINLEATKERLDQQIRKQLEEHPIEITEAMYKYWMKMFLKCECVHQFDPINFSDWNDDPKCMHCGKFYELIRYSERVVFIPVEIGDRYIYTSIQRPL